MKVLIAGCGALGSNIVKNLVPDLRGEHEITVLDKDVVEERNVTPGTQFYTPDQVGTPKVEALQFNIYKWYQREIQIFNNDFRVEHVGGYVSQDVWQTYGLVIDCFDNYHVRNEAQKIWTRVHRPVLHVGFSANYTFAIEWAEHYKVPSDIVKGIDICEMPGAAAFVASVASLGALVAEEFILKGEKIEIVGGKFTHSLIK